MASQLNGAAISSTIQNGLQEKNYRLVRFWSSSKALQFDEAKEDMFANDNGNNGTLGVRNGKDRSSDPTSLLLPDPKLRASMASVASTAWGSFRLSVQNFSRTAVLGILVAPCSRHRCCIGCISLRDAVGLICVAELVIIGLCSLIAVDIYRTDGRTFYTKEMEGEGTTVAIGFAAFFLISVLVIILTLAAWQFRKPSLYIVHILWQWSVLEALLLFTYAILKRTFSPELRQRTSFLLPSAVVLSVVGVTGVVVQSWWTFVFVDAMFFEMSKTEERCNSPKYGYNDDEESVSIVSRPQSQKIPVVKVDSTNSLDTESIVAPSMPTWTGVNEASGFTDVIDV